MKITFNKARVKQLLMHSRRNKPRRPTFEQLLDPQYLKAPLPPQQGFPTEDDLDLTLIPSGLILVADHGIYLMSNGRNPNENKPQFQYAAEAHPQKTTDWYDLKISMFGGDDIAQYLSDDLISDWLRSTPRPTLSITSDGNTLSFH